MKGQVANFGNTANTSITVDAPTTVARLNFSGTGLNIGGGSTLTLDDTSINSSLSGKVTGRTEINLTGTSGEQTISAPLLLAKDTQVWTATAAQRLTLTNLQPSNVVLSKAGAGTLVVNNVRTNRLNVNGGTVAVASNGTASGTSVVGGLTIATDGKLDLADNDMVVRHAAGAGVATLAQVTDGVKRGLNLDGGGYWNGNGITSSTAAAESQQRTALGVISNDLAIITNGQASGAFYTDFGGTTVDENAVLVKYTWFGDADLNGTVDGSDYFQIDNGFLNNATGWVNGDFDYSGSIDGTDYFLTACS